jgi:fluoride exporter
MRLLLLAATGGAIGAGARYLVTTWAVSLLGAAFPWGTLTVNVVGSFLMGVLVAAAEPLLAGSGAARTFLATGILGGFTTFSAFSLDAHQLLERRELMLAAFYVVGSVTLSILALVAGLVVTKAALE